MMSKAAKRKHKDRFKKKRKKRVDQTIEKEDNRYLDFNPLREH